MTEPLLLLNVSVIPYISSYRSHTHIYHDNLAHRAKSLISLQLHGREEPGKSFNAARGTRDTFAQDQ